MYILDTEPSVFEDDKELIELTLFNSIIWSASHLRVPIYV